MSIHIPKKFVNEFTLQNICNKKIQRNVKLYLFGLQWCLNMYRTGEYTYTKFIFSGDSLHPILIHLMIELNKYYEIDKLLPDDFTCNEIIPSEIYPAIVMPYSHIDLVDKKYHNLLNTKLKYIYDEEKCHLCNKIKDDKEQYNEHKKIHNIDNPKQYLDNIIELLQSV